MAVEFFASKQPNSVECAPSDRFMSSDFTERRVCFMQFLLYMNCFMQAKKSPASTVS